MAILTIWPIYIVPQMMELPYSYATLSLSVSMVWVAIMSFLSCHLMVKAQETMVDRPCVLCCDTGLKPYDSDPDSPTEELIICPLCATGDKLSKSFPAFKATCTNLMSVDDTWTD